MKFRWAASAFIFCAFGGSFLLTHSVRAQDSQVQVLVGDVCPNIPGNQPSLPSGMLHDQNGNCYTPTPLPPPDACPNIAGYQSAIPDGHYRNAAGDCVPQTTPPKDVCSNIAGTQSSVPKGMYTASNGKCLWPAQDRCPNITGTQDPVPEGMERDQEGDCFTPDTSSPPQETPGTPTQPGSTAPPNTPAATKPAAGIIPDVFRELLRHTSPTLARSLPYYVIGTIAVVTLFFFWQAAGEAMATHGIVALFKRKKRLANETDDFIALSSQYLQTTVSGMQKCLETLTTQNEVAAESIASLTQATSALRLGVEGLLSDISANTAAATTAPHPANAHSHTLRSPLFWIPVALVALVALSSNLLFGGVGGIDLGATNLSLQAVAFVAVAALFYAAVRVRHARHAKHQIAERLSDQAKGAEMTREGFIQQAIQLLSDGLRGIDTHRAFLADVPSAQAFLGGYAGLESLLAKLRLLSQVRSSTGPAAKFNIRDVIDACLLLHQTAIDAKKLSVTNTSEPRELTRSRPLINSVLSGVLDSAVQLSREGGGITVATDMPPHKLEVRIGTTSSIVTDEQLAGIFDPAQPLILDDDSPSLSLFLDKIIVDELGGNITAHAAPGAGVVFTVTVPA